MDVWETCFFVPGLTKSVCAAWVQAWGSIGAIAAAAVLLLIQHVLEKTRERERAMDDTVRRMRIVEEVARSTARNIKYLQERLSTRESVHFVATGRQYFSADAVLQLPDAAAAIPLHELDSPTLVFEVRAVANLARQMKTQVEWMLNNHSQMDGPDYDLAFEAYSNIANAANDSVRRIKEHVDRVQRERRVPLESPARPADADYDITPGPAEEAIRING